MTLTKKIYTYLFISFLLTACNAEENLSFQRFTDIYEPSGVVQLHDGRILLVEDEKEHPFSLLQLNQDDSFTRLPLSKLVQTKNGIKKIKLDDLEAMTLGADNWVYAITSHSKTSSGKRKQYRERLVRFQVADEQLVNYQSLSSLRGMLSKALPRQSMHKLNIEGLAYDHTTNSLLLGFRRPLQHKKAIIVQLTQIDEAFKKSDVNLLSAKTTLVDLHGRSIRSLDYDPILQAYLLVAGSQKSRNSPFSLWLWDGQAVKPVAITGLDSIAYTEGITSIKTASGEPALLLVSDDGKRGGTKGHYIILPYNRLQINQ